VTWLQFFLLILIVYVGLELTFRRLRSVLVVRGSVDQALSAISGRVDRHDEHLQSHDQRIERLEVEAKIR